MAAELASSGLILCDTGQCEIVGSIEVEATEISINQTIQELLQIAACRGYRLLAVEAGDIEGGRATVLASEVGYTPWWIVERNDR